MQDKLVSFLVPAYKAEKYIGACLKSILSQTYKNIEIIVIDDGSTDDTGKIADDFAKSDKRVIVIHKKNEGVSAARNDSIAAAKGEFVAFVDADDIIAPDFCETLMNLQEERKAGIVVCSSIKFKDENQLISTGSGKINELNNIQALERSFIKNGYMGTAWGKIFDKNLFNGITFPYGRISEDDATIYKAVFNAEKTVIIEKEMYYYRITKDSLTNSRFSLNELGYIITMEERAEFFRKKGLESMYYKTLAFCCSIVIKFYCRVYMSGVENRKKHLKELFTRFKTMKKEVMKSKYTKFKLKVIFQVFSIWPQSMTVFLLLSDVFRKNNK